jgi:sulfur-carrier protein
VTRVVLPYHLRNLAGVDGEVLVDAATAGEVVDALERLHPPLRGTIRDTGTGRRRPFVRFFACGEDLSHEPLDAPLPDAVRAGTEPLLIVGAMAGG